MMKRYDIRPRRAANSAAIDQSNHPIESID